MSDSLLVISEDGFGKRTPLSEYHRQKRGGRGMVTASHPPLAAAMVVEPDDEIMVATNTGKIVRIDVCDVPTRGRSARGARLVELVAGDRVTTAAKVPKNALRIDAEGVSP